MSLITRDFLGNHHSSTQLPLPDFKERNHVARCRSTDTNQATDLQDLNQPPLNLLDDTNLDLNLVSLSSSWSSSSSSQPYTLGKVKSALEQAEKEYAKKRSNSMPKSFVEDEETYAAACPSCLLYVLISNRNPRCPSCNMMVPYPATMKKPRIDLNINI